jgi:hypothetical protein
MRAPAFGTLLAAGAMLAAAVLLGCESPPQGVLFHATLSNPDGAYPLPVILGDQTGLVVGVGPAVYDPVDFRNAGILADPTEPRAFIVTWLGGACDSNETLVLRSTATGYDLELAEHEKAGLGCIALGVLRGLRVETSKAIPIAAITISGDRKIELRIDEDCGPLATAGTNDAKVACFAFISATIGDQTDPFASLTVTPEDGGCPGTECSTAAGIAARTWRVDATDRTGERHAWRCTYGGETASCTVIAAPSPP